MKITVLTENTACRENLTAEHGLSLYIETEKRRILFDAGQTEAFADNASKLGVDLGTVDFAILSHGHYDHSGGLRRFRKENPNALIYLSRFAFQPHFNRSGKDIGMDPDLQNLSGLVYTQGEQALDENMTLYTLDAPPADTAGMTFLENGISKAEDFRHEQYLLIRERGKKILFSGCSHKGILSIAAHFRPDVLIGGFHFMNITDEAFLDQAAGELLALPAVYYTGHCTGEEQFAYLKQRMGDRLYAAPTGSVWEI